VWDQPKLLNLSLGIVQQAAAQMPRDAVINNLRQPIVATRRDKLLTAQYRTSEFACVLPEKGR
jgi:hypothetical protein